MAEKKTLGFIGLGSMGHGMAGRLLDAGHELLVHDTVPAALEALVRKGAKAAGGTAAVAAGSAVVFTSLPTPEVSRAVARDVRNGKARIFVDLSTTGPRASAEIAHDLAQDGIALVDAPVSGGRAGAIKGTLAVMAAGPKAAYAEVEALLKCFGKVFYVGEKPGLGQTVKLVNNLLSVTALAVSAEGLAMGVKAGLDPAVMLDVINASSGRNSATTDKIPRAVLPRSFDFGFAAGLSAKDIRLCLQEANALGVPTVVGAAVQQLLAVTNALYGPEADLTAICKTVEQWAGVEIKSAAKPAAA